MKSKKLLVLLFVGIVFTYLSLIPTWNSEAADNTEIDIVGLEWGSSFVYNFDANELGPAQYFSINLAVADNIVVGFNTINGDGAVALDYNLLKLSYFISAKKKPMGIDILVGGGGVGPNITAGAGLFINLFQKKIEESFSTILKCKIYYLFTDTVNTSGSLMASLTGQLGL